MEKKRNNNERRNIIAIFIAIVFATYIRDYIFTIDMVEKTFWSGLAVYMLVFTPIYVFLYWFLGKFMKKD